MHQNIRGAIASLKARYLAEGGKESTWQGDYAKIYKHLDQDRPLTGERLARLVQRWPPNTKTRNRACMAANKLAKHHGLDWHAGKLKGKYKPSPVDPLTIPSDKAIAAEFHKLRNPGWRWVYGAIATYGLRPHEALRGHGQNFDDEELFFHVPQDTKTGARLVLPLYPEWFYSFQIRKVRLPNLDWHRDNSALGHSATEYFGDTARIPFNLYALRHAWARRAYEFGIDDAIASLMMGHGVEVHRQHYKTWFDRQQLRAVLRGALTNPDRPKPP